MEHLINETKYLIKMENIKLPNVLFSKTTKTFSFFKKKKKF